MATAKFKVTPEEIERSANQVEQKIKEFQQLIQSIYNAIEELKVKYAGESSEVFNSKIRGYEDDFNRAQQVLTNYVGSLRTYASDMKRTEEAIKSKFGQLKIGKTY